MDTIQVAFKNINKYISHNKKIVLSVFLIIIICILLLRFPLCADSGVMFNVIINLVVVSYILILLLILSQKFFRIGGFLCFIFAMLYLYFEIITHPIFKIKNLLVFLLLIIFSLIQFFPYIRQNKTLIKKYIFTYLINRKAVRTVIVLAVPFIISLLLFQWFSARLEVQISEAKYPPEIEVKMRLINPLYKKDDLLKIINSLTNKIDFDLIKYNYSVINKQKYKTSCNTRDIFYRTVKVGLDVKFGTKEHKYFDIKYGQKRILASNFYKKNTKKIIEELEPFDIGYSLDDPKSSSIYTVDYIGHIYFVVQPSPVYFLYFYIFSFLLILGLIKIWCVTKNYIKTGQM